MYQRILRVTAMLALVCTTGCASGSYPELPAQADYARSCPELIDAYRKADSSYKGRRATSATTDVTLVAGTVAAVAASAATAGAPIILGGVVLSVLKGDMGAGHKAEQRETLEQIAVHNGCSSADVMALREEHVDQTSLAEPARSGHP